MLRTIVAVVLALVVVVLGSALIFNAPQGVPITSGIDISSARLPLLQELTARTDVREFDRSDRTVSYTYQGQQVPEVLAQDEVPELRTSTSYTQYLGAVAGGVDPILKMSTRIYPQPSFVKSDDGSWHYVEYATTTTDVWSARPLSLIERIRDFLIPSVYANTDQIFSGAGDGYVGVELTGVGFAAARTAASGNAAAAGTTAARILAYRETGPTDSSIDRTFLPFNTGGTIPAGSTISAATLKVWITAVNDASDDTFDYMTVGTSSQASEATLSTADYNKVTVTLTTGSEIIDSGQRKDFTTLGTGAYTTLTLNATGIAEIRMAGSASTCSATAGYTCISLRVGNDAAGTQPSTAFAENSATMSTSEETGTSQDPYLEVTYTAPASAIVVQSGLKISSFGSLKITGGGMKIH